MEREDDLTIERDGQEEDGMSESDIADQEARADNRLGKLKRELETTKRERQEYMDGWQRSKADYVNALKRFESERDAAKEAGLVKAIGALVPAYDALERAKEHGDVPPGFEGIIKQIEGAFEKLGVTQIGQVGEAFDPSRHEALGTDTTDDSSKDDQVTVVLEKGYQVGESVLRPARVRVAHYEA